MSELGPIPPGLQALYADERTAPVGGAEERARIRSRVLASVGVAAGVAGSANAASSPGVAGSASTAVGAAPIAGKIVVFALALGALGGGWYWRASSSAMADERGAIAPSEVAQVPDPVVLPVTPSVSVAVVRPSSPPLPPAATVAPAAAPAAIASSPPASRPAPGVLTPRRQQPPSMSTPATAQREAASPVPEVDPPAPEAAPPAPEGGRAPDRSQAILLVRAWGAIRRGDAQTALELVERDRGEHPESDFTEEREAVHIVALRRLHEDARARVAAQAFVARYPDSIHRSLVEPSLGEAP